MKRVILTMFAICMTLLALNFAANASATVENGAIYWEISENGGSGRNNTITNQNPYITESREIIVNGYSFLAADGSIIKYSCDPTKDSINIPDAPVGTDKTMLHIHSLTTRLGWISSENVNLNKTALNEQVVPEEPVEPKRITPEEFAEQIDEKEGTTLIFVDQSGSMNVFVEQATRAFNNLDLTNKTIIVFAEGTKIIKANEISDFHYEIGGGTNIYGSLNEAIKYNPENIILISDLGDNYEQVLKEIPSLKTVDILCPDEWYPSNVLDQITTTWHNAKVKVSIIK